MNPFAWCTGRLRRGLVVLTCLLLVFYAGVGYLATSPLIGENPRWRRIDKSPADFGLTGETISFHSQDDVSLKAWWLRADGKPRANVIVVHGIDHTRQAMLPRASFLVHGGYNVLAVDLRGHGESAAQYVSPGYLEARDVLGAVDYLRERGERQPVAVLGVSYGAAAALLAARSGAIAAVIADGVYPSGRHVLQNIRRHYFQDRKTRLSLRALFLLTRVPGVLRAVALVYYARTGVYLGSDLVSVLPAASRLTIPVLFISGTHDWIVPTEQTREVMSVLPGEHKSLVVIPHADHDTTFSTAPALYRNAVLAFLDANFDK
jgi:pimeloyl-ACP methyl ester carboxylesterase